MKYLILAILSFIFGYVYGIFDMLRIGKIIKFICEQEFKIVKKESPQNKPK